ncbi:hypothetical protein [Streptomyces sp. 769]|uniref:hypothetical protein n=1 Tax=Streptomyces sp. 769 TaxID=1262452 RepID=UPI00057D4FA6|nr:hypothetical protein [Streptomyces sp. 769]
MGNLSEVEPGTNIRVRFQGHEDIADGVYDAQVDFVFDDHLMVWVAAGNEDGFAVAVMKVDEEGVWCWSKRPTT